MMFTFKLLAIVLFLAYCGLCASNLNCSSHNKTDPNFNSPTRIQNKPSSVVFSAAVSVVEASAAVTNNSNALATATPVSTIVTGRPVKTSVSMRMLGPESKVAVDSSDGSDDATAEEAEAGHENISPDPYDSLEQLILQFIDQQKRAGLSTGVILQGISRSVRKATESYLAAEEASLLMHTTQPKYYFGWYESA